MRAELGAKELTSWCGTLYGSTWQLRLFRITSAVS